MNSRSATRRSHQASSLFLFMATAASALFGFRKIHLSTVEAFTLLTKNKLRARSYSSISASRFRFSSNVGSNFLFGEQTIRRKMSQQSVPSGTSSQLSSATLGNEEGENTGQSATKEIPNQAAPSNGSNSTNNTAKIDDENSIPLYHAEGLFAVHKPLNWTSQDMVGYIRGILERDARNRGATVTPMRSRRNKSRKVKVGHGGTLDPLANGVLVIGVGKGTKQLNDYLSGSKAYRATGKLGVETSTLDMDETGTVVKEKPWEHITQKAIEEVLPEFRGTISQIPPLYSAKRVNGKKLYEVARSGEADESLVIEAKQVEIYNLTLESVELPHFTIDMECGGGTFVRSLIRDVAYKLDSCATTTFLQRTKQGPFVLKDCLQKEDLTAESIYAEIKEWNEKLVQQVDK